MTRALPRSGTDRILLEAIDLISFEVLTSYRSRY